METSIKFENRGQLFDSIVKQLNLTKIREEYFPNSFGNFFVEFIKDDLLIRYSNDRSDLTIEVASRIEPSNSMDLSFVRNFLFNKKINSQNEYSDNGVNRIIELNTFLTENINEILKLFSKQNYQNTVCQIKTQLKQVSES